MKRIILLLWLINIFMSCANDKKPLNSKPEKQKVAMEEIKLKLETGEKFQREEPFSMRTFDPYLKGEWIGNAVSYGAYRKGQAPGEKGPSKAEILQDLTIIINHWNLIRVYGSGKDAENVLQVIKENELPVKVMVGIWLATEENNPGRRTENIEQVVSAIELANKYENIVAAVNVGNESQVYWSGHRVKSSILTRYIRAVRMYTNVPVTTADDYNFWNKPESKAVADEIDFIVTHAYAMWNGKTLENAISWTDSIFFEDVQKNHPDKQIVIGETGWATNYDPTQTGPDQQGTLIKGEVGIKAQEQFLYQLNNWINEKKITTFLFEAFDEPWKGGGEASGPDEVEKHWGVFYENRMPKESFSNYLKSIETVPEQP